MARLNIFVNRLTHYDMESLQNQCFFGGRFLAVPAAHIDGFSDFFFFSSYSDSLSPFTRHFDYRRAARS